MPFGQKFYYYTSRGSDCGTRPTLISHDSSVVVGEVPMLYRPTTDYYTEENAIIPTSYTKQDYVGSTMNVYMVYQDSTAPQYSIYTYGGTTNSVNIMDGGGSTGSTYDEDAIIFSSLTKKRLIAVYFVGYLTKSGTSSPINLSPYDQNPTGDSTWTLSYKIDSTRLIQMASGAKTFTEGDQVETGIHYGPKNYPIIPTGGTFIPGVSLPTNRATIRRALHGDLRVETKSTDVGVYLGGTKASFDFKFDIYNDTSKIPDIENAYAVASVAIPLTGGGTQYFNYTLTPSILGSSSTTYDFAGSITAVGGASGAPTGTYTVYYWDSAIKSGPLSPSGVTTTIFNQRDFSGPTYGPDILRFYYTFTCAASGTPRIVEPTFNGSLTGTNSAGVSRTINVNAVGGYWHTRGYHIGDSSGNITGNACGTPFIFPSVTLVPFNYNNITNNSICTCYFK